MEKYYELKALSKKQQQDSPLIFFCFNQKKWTEVILTQLSNRTLFEKRTTHLLLLIIDKLIDTRRL